MDLVGQRIDRYEVVAELGRGASGAVFRARDPRLERDVAVKVLLRLDKTATARFEREQQAWTRLQHQHLARVHDVGMARGVPFIVMELVEGQTLAELVEQVGPPPARRSAQVLRDVARAIAYAHGQGVLHRDIKPANILLTRDGEPRVVDFGLAALADADASLTKTGALLGTPAYMSPEQAAGLRADERSDVYGLGATLYDLLTGRPPFVDAPLFEVHRSAVESPRVHNPTVPPELEAICLRALAREPDDRYPDVASLVEALEAFLEREPKEEAEPAPAALRVAVGVVLLGVVVALAALLGVRASQPVVEPAPAPVAAAPTPEARRATEPLDLEAALAEVVAGARAGALLPELLTELRELERRLPSGDVTGRKRIELTRGRLAYRRLQLQAGLEALTPLLREPAPVCLEAAVMLAELYLSELRTAELKALLESAPVGVAGGADDGSWRSLLESQRALVLAKDRERGIALALRANRRDPQLFVARRWLAGLRFQRVEWEELRALRAEAPDDVQLMLIEARKLGTNKAPREVDELLRRAWELSQPRRCSALVSHVARVAILRGDGGQALRYLEEAPDGGSRNVRSGFAFLRGSAHDLLFRPAEARREWRRARQLSPKLTEQTLSALSSPVRLRVRRALRLGPEGKVLGQAEQNAIEARVARAEPHARTKFREVLTQAALGWPMAELDLKGLIAVAGESSQVQGWIGVILAGRDVLVGARAAFLVSLKRRWTPHVALRLALTELRMKDMGNATRRLAEIARRSPKTAPGKCARGILFSLQGDRARALETCEEALAINPFMAAALELKSRELGRAGRVSDGLAALRRAARGAHLIDAQPVTLLANIHLKIAAQRKDARIWEQTFERAERVMSVSYSVGLRLDAARAAMQLGPESPWFASAWDWLYEAETYARNSRHRTPAPVLLQQGLYLLQREEHAQKARRDPARTARERAKVAKRWGEAVRLGARLEPSAYHRFQQVLGAPFRPE